MSCWGTVEGKDLTEEARGRMGYTSAVLTVTHLLDQGESDRPKSVCLAKKDKLGLQKCLMIACTLQDPGFLGILRIPELSSYLSHSQPSPESYH